jgi:hypothetical protein
MSVSARMSTKSLALTITFTALYVVFGFIKISPIIGLPSQAITAAAIIAPLMGILLGPYVGTLSTLFGGIIGFFFGSFSLPSFVSGSAAALIAGLVRVRKRFISVIVYSLLFFLLFFYPIIGPIWLFPMVSWFQILGFIILASPLQTVAARNLDSGGNSRLLWAFFLVCLASTLAGQIAGSLTLAVMLIPDVAYWTATWEAVTFIYPVERVLIAVFSALLGVSLYRFLKSTNLLPSGYVEEQKTTIPR